MIAITRSKSLKRFKSNANIFDKYMTSSNSDAMPDNIRRHNSVNRDDVTLTFCEFTSLYKACILEKFHDDQRSRTC